MKSIMLLALSLVCIGSFSASAADRDRIGNGGEFHEMAFVSVGYQALDLMRELRRLHDPAVSGIDFVQYSNLLSRLRVKFVDQAVLESENRSAVNYPAEGIIEATSEDWEKNRQARESVLQMVLHETLPMIQVPDKSYSRSAPLLVAIQKHGLFSKFTSPPTDAQKPEKLFSRYWSEDDIGLTYTDAQRICENVKRQHHQRYFYVYCKFLQKKQTVQSAYAHPIYGLEVFGWGSTTNPVWTVVGSSLGLANGLIDRTFATARDAYRACRARLEKENQEDPRFYRAICRSPKFLDKDAYYYEIITHNPLLNTEETP